MAKPKKRETRSLVTGRFTFTTYRDPKAEEARKRIVNSEGPITLLLPFESWDNFKRTIKKRTGAKICPGTIVHLTDGDFLMESYVYADDGRWCMLRDLAPENH